MTRPRRSLTALAIAAGALALGIPIGTACHEFIGHGLVGLLCGGTVDYVEILGLKVYPNFVWVGWPFGFFFGRCNVTGLATEQREHLMSLGGSLSTWLVAVLATCALRLWQRFWSTHRWSFTILAALTTWWIDALTYTVPVCGLKRFILWGSRYPEPYTAATALGCPGWLFIVIVIASSAAMAASTAQMLTSPHRRAPFGTSARQSIP